MITTIVKEHKIRFGLTFLLISLEAITIILFPLFIGFAIDDALMGEHTGAIWLGVLGFLSMIIGVGRRVLDSRFYASIFQKMGSSLLFKLEANQASIKTARLNMLKELVEFLENTLPELLNSVLSLIGVILILITLNTKVFICCLVATGLIALIYLLSSRKTVLLNKAYNDEAEKQVDEITKNSLTELDIHLKRLMQWNVKLSDLEAVNLLLSWMVLIGFLILSILLPIRDGLVQYGALLSLVMYAFQYIESIINLPIFYQNWLRLWEIKERLST